MATNPPVNSPGIPSNPNNAGGPASPDQVEILKRFREKFLPDARLEAQDTFAKWLFGLTTTVAALGTGLSNAAFSKLSSWGVLTYSLAVLAAGAGLACAVVVLGVELPDANWQSLEAMITEFKKPLRAKKIWLIWATISFGMSLTLAATAVFLTAMQRRPSENPSGISARLSDRKLEPAISLSGLRPGAPAELQAFEEVGGKTILIGVFRQIADDTGQITYKAAEFKIPSEAQGLKLMLAYDRGERRVTEEREFAFPAEPPVAKDSSGSGAGSHSGHGAPPTKGRAKKAAAPCSSGS